MAEWTGTTPRTLNELQASDALRLFLEAYWERGDKMWDDVAVLLSFLDRDMWSDGMPLDIAQWDNFRAAVDEVLGSGK